MNTPKDGGSRLDWAPNISLIATVNAMDSRMGWFDDESRIMQIQQLDESIGAKLGKN